MKVKKADDVTASPVKLDGAERVEIRILIGDDEAAENFCMRQFNVATGGCTPRHRHNWEHEVYVLAGKGVVVSEDGQTLISAGHCVYVAPDEEHQFRNIGGEELKFLCLVPKKQN